MAVEEGLTADQVAFFRDNGYLVIPNFLSQENVSNLLETTNRMLNDFPLESHPLTKFTTGDNPDASEDNAKHVGDDYFISSNDKVRFFFDPDAFKSTVDAHGKPELARPKHMAINKIGHALHDLSKPFSDVTHTSDVGHCNAAIARSLGFQDPRVLQSMVICKQPSIGAAVPPHKDSEFLYTNPPSAVGWWIALQDATSENGGLGFWKGSHKRSPVRRRFVKAAPEVGGTEFIPWDGPGMAKELESEPQAPTAEGDYKANDADFTLVNAPAGSLVLIHGNVQHASQRNTSSNSRFAYAFHVIEGADGWTYDERNWLQPPGNGKGFTRLYDVQNDV